MLHEYKQKTKFILLGTTITVLLLTTISLKQTINNILKYKKHKKQITIAKTAPKEIKRYKKLLTTLKTTQPVTNKDQLFQVVSNFEAKHQLTIINLGEPEITIQENYSIATHEIKVQGRFKEITQLIYDLEQQERVGNVVSTTYHTKLDKRNRKKVLTARIVVQHVSPITNKYS